MLLFVNTHKHNITIACWKEHLSSWLMDSQKLFLTHEGLKMTHTLVAIPHSKSKSQSRCVQVKELEHYHCLLHGTLVSVVDGLTETALDARVPEEVV